MSHFAGVLPVEQSVGAGLPKSSGDLKIVAAPIALRGRAFPIVLLTQGFYYAYGSSSMLAAELRP